MKRRSLLQGMALVSLGSFTPLLSAQPEKTRQIFVGDLEVFRVKVNHRGNWIIVRLQTDSGITGIGEASHGGKDEEVFKFLKEFSALLRGQSIYAVEWFRNVTAPSIQQNGAPAAVAASALEHCLWDIRGKALSVPVYEFFGGKVHDQIRNYANINRSTEDRTPEGFAKNAERAIAAGFDAIKLAPFDGMPRNLRDTNQIQPFADRGIACAKAVRETIGPKRDLLIDVHSYFDVDQGLELTHRFEALDLFWLEEVTPAEPVQDLATIHKAAKMPTAGGESIHGVEGFYPYIKAEAVDIVMPDVKVCGGLLELKKIAAIAQGAGLQVSPHGPASPVGNIAAAHVASTLPNFNILEFSYGEVPWRAELIEPAEELASGRLSLSNRPGFGIALNEKTAAKYAVS